MTSFTTPNGTFGPQMKPNGVFRWMMARQVKSVRRRGAKALKPSGVGTLVLTSVGRKSGRTFETPLAFWPLPDGSWIVCASAGGAAKHPSWYWNLAGGSDKASISVGGDEVPVHAEELHGTDRDAAWERITATSRQFLRYTTKTDRALPVIRFTRRGA